MRLAFLALLAALAQDDVVKKIVPEAEKIKKLAKKIPPPGKDKIEKALGEKLDPADLSPSLWECYCSVPRVSTAEKTRCVLTSVTVKGPKGPVKVGVAIAVMDKTIHVVRILDNQDEKALDSRLFLSQFDGFPYVSEAVASPPSGLADALKKGQGADDAAKETDALVRLCVLMRAMGPKWDRMMERIDKKDKSAAEDAGTMEKDLEETLKLLPAFKFFKTTKQEKFKGFATGGRTEMGEVRKLLDAGKFDEAFRRVGPLDKDFCAKCHASYQNEYRSEREKRNLGNGSLSTKLEVACPDPKLEASYQAVANAIRKAILLATEAK